MVTPPEITSRTNPRVKGWRALRDRAERDRTGRFLIEGLREVTRAADHLTIVESIVQVDQLPIDLPNIVTVNEHVFGAITARQHPDGLAVVAETPDFDLCGFEPPLPRLVLVADGIEKPGNLGGMVRTADALGASLLASSAATDLANPNVVRAAQGSLFSAPIASVARSEAMEWCEHHTKVIVTVPNADSTIWDVDMTGDVSLVVGSEHAGVDHGWMAVATAASIPMVGRADSLNASVTAALVVAEAVRQRSG